MHKANRGLLKEGRHVCSKSHSRVCDRDKGVAGRNYRELYFPDKGSLIWPMTLRKKETEKIVLVTRPGWCWSGAGIRTTCCWPSFHWKKSCDLRGHHHPSFDVWEKTRAHKLVLWMQRFDDSYLKYGEFGSGGLAANSFIASWDSSEVCCSDSLLKPPTAQKPK